MWKYYLYVSEKLGSFVHFHLFVWRINQNSWITAKLSIHCLLLLAVSKVVIHSHQASKWVYRDLGNPYQLLRTLSAFSCARFILFACEHQRELLHFNAICDVRCCWSLTLVVWTEQLWVLDYPSLLNNWCQMLVSFFVIRCCWSLTLVVWAEQLGVLDCPSLFNNWCQMLVSCVGIRC